MKNIIGGSLIALLCSVNCLAAPPADPDPANLSTEQGTLNRYVSDLRLFHKDAGSFAKKATLTAADVDGLKRRADGLKSRASGAQSATGSVVRKLKASGEFDGLDAALAKKVTDPRRRSLLLQNSFAKFLEQSASNLSSSAGQISVPVDKLRTKLTGGSPTPVPANVFEQVCESARILTGVMIQAGMEVDPGQWDTFSCACAYAAGNFDADGLGTGRDCDESMGPLIY
jgi:hypothetical protein